MPPDPDDLERSPGGQIPLHAVISFSLRDSAKAAALSEANASAIHVLNGGIAELRGQILGHVEASARERGLIAQEQKLQGERLIRIQEATQVLLEMRSSVQTHHDTLQQQAGALKLVKFLAFLYGAGVFGLVWYVATHPAKEMP